MSLHVGIYLFDLVEVLDFAGPYEVFTCASRVHARSHRGDLAAFRVSTIAATGMPVRARAGLQVIPDHDFGTHPAVDCLVIPGGVIDAELGKAEVTEWIRNISGKARVTASVCTGAFLLANCGCLSSGPATTHWEDVPRLRQDYPRLDVKEGVRWTEAGRVVTSAGISSGIHMSLHLVELLHSRELARATARQMDFDWG